MKKMGRRQLLLQGTMAGLSPIFASWVGNGIPQRTNPRRNETTEQYCRPRWALTEKIDSIIGELDIERRAVISRSFSSHRLDHKLLAVLKRGEVTAVQSFGDYYDYSPLYQMILASARKKRVALFCSEWEIDKNIRRLLSVKSGIPLLHLEHGSRLRSADWRRITRAAVKLGELDIQMIPVDFSPSEFYINILNELSVQPEVIFINATVIDSGHDAQETNSETSHRRNQRSQKSIFDLAKQRNVPVVVSTMINNSLFPQTVSALDTAESSFFEKVNAVIEAGSTEHDNESLRRDDSENAGIWVYRNGLPAQCIPASYHRLTNHFFDWIG